MTEHATLEAIGQRRTTSDGTRSDEQLIAACRAGDQAAWTEVYERYHRLVRSISRSYGARQHEAEEVVQIAFSVLFDSIHRIRPDSNLAAWLSTIARRHTWRLLEKRHRNEAPAPADAIETHDDPFAESTVHGVWRDELVREALRRLAPKHRNLIEVLYLRGDEPSYHAVAAELGMPIGSIGPTRARCLEKLRAIVESLEGGQVNEEGR